MMKLNLPTSFHSIGIPSEWGLKFPTFRYLPTRGGSIQLGSPASGDTATLTATTVTRQFPFNWDPQRVGTLDVKNSPRRPPSFHSIGIHSEWGLGIFYLQL